MISDSCLSVLYVTLVHGGQTAGRIKMKLGKQVGLVRGHIVIDGDPPPSPKGRSPPMFGPFVLWPNGCMDQDATWYRGRPQPRRLCVRWGPSPLPKQGWSPKFSAHIYCGQTVAWIKKMPLGTEVGFGLRDIVLDGDPAFPPLKGHSPPIFGQCPLWLNGWMD